MSLRTCTGIEIFRSWAINSGLVSNCHSLATPLISCIKSFASLADHKKVLHVSTESLRFVTKIISKNALVLVLRNFQELKSIEIRLS